MAVEHLWETVGGGGGDRGRQGWSGGGGGQGGTDGAREGGQGAGEGPSYKQKPCRTTLKITHTYLCAVFEAGFLGNGKKGTGAELRVYGEVSRSSF